MDENGFGFVHDEIEIKMLILYIICRLPSPVTIDQLSDIALACDGGFTYFDFTDALASLVTLGHISEENGKYSVTQNGRETNADTESTVPYSARTKAERLCKTLAAALIREEMIKTSFSPRNGGGFTVSLSMADSSGKLIGMDFLVGTEEQARKIIANFRENAESLYPRLVGLLLEK